LSEQLALGRLKTTPVKVVPNGLADVAKWIEYHRQGKVNDTFSRFDNEFNQRSLEGKRREDCLSDCRYPVGKIVAVCRVVIDSEKVVSNVGWCSSDNLLIVSASAIYS